jgi:hypothetical protein
MPDSKAGDACLRMFRIGFMHGYSENDQHLPAAQQGAVPSHAGTQEKSHD